MVRDDGRGIDSSMLHTGRKGHWGLTGMRERAEAIGSSLKLRSRIGAGTEVDLTVPRAFALGYKTQGRLSRWLPWLNRERFESSAMDERNQTKR